MRYKEKSLSSSVSTSTRWLDHCSADCCFFSYPPDICIFATYYHQGGNSQESNRCVTQLDSRSSIRIGQAVAWELLLIYDILLFVLAVHNAFMTRRELRLLRNRTSLRVILLRDGKNYDISQFVKHSNILSCNRLYERWYSTSCKQFICDSSFKVNVQPSSSCRH
ncbi:hypothetical protein K435DRAFT_792959 [Dendrothele bispora CBS 962.96]|uniref:Uncharacterized protein n=1 Tax=Dendrothele bispora (strain CBS 962.96) TaxID=1314807 RepID=A0A4S8MGR4_DENBC|nr:hypothetical protein K435DRAFT_792959 [Dendrothele bispora CBS 962.96]